MLRDVWFWEVEVVRVEGGAPAAAPWRLDFSVRPLNYLLGGLLAGTAAATAVAGYAYYGPEEIPWNGASACPLGPEGYDEPWIYRGCGCGRAIDPYTGVVTPLPPDGDSTRLVRRLR